MEEPEYLPAGRRSYSLRSLPSTWKRSRYAPPASPGEYAYSWPVRFSQAMPERVCWSAGWEGERDTVLPCFSYHATDGAYGKTAFRSPSDRPTNVPAQASLGSTQWTKMRHRFPQISGTGTASPDAGNPDTPYSSQDWKDMKQMPTHVSWHSGKPRLRTWRLKSYARRQSRGKAKSRRSRRGRGARRRC